MTKYTFYESGKKWVKVLIEFKGIKNHGEDKISCTFNKRSLQLKILNYNGHNY